MATFDSAPSVNEHRRPERSSAPRTVVPPSAQDSAPTALEESLVADARAGLTPAQMVERKLASLLKSNPLPVSHFMTWQRVRPGRW